MSLQLPVGQGKDARQRRLHREQERRRKAAESLRLYGQDLGELEPCAWCGKGHRPNFCTDPGEHLDPLYRWHWNQPVHGGASINPDQRATRTRKDERCLLLARHTGAIALVEFEDRTRALVSSRGLRAIRTPDASPRHLARPPPGRAARTNPDQKRTDEIESQTKKEMHQCLVQRQPKHPQSSKPRRQSPPRRGGRPTSPSSCLTQ